MAIPSSFSSKLALAIFARQPLLRRLPATRSLARQVLLLDCCRSSNDSARQRLAEGQSMDGWLLVAHEQTGGRGRSARDWWSGPAGTNVALTLGLQQPQLPPEVFGLLGACALADCCVTVVGESSRVALKWPNDLLLDGAKAGGFLCELPADGNGTMLLGLGLNLNASPARELTPYPTISLAAAAGQTQLDGTDLLAAWLWNLERALRRYLRAGPAAFEQRFLELLRYWAAAGLFASPWFKLG
jgi:BirA family transcriptional regulator, biotin operon repressor / biotin---[acetyl-CoA-carboxylase] ligase